jgi:putative ABC transport system substrate-binding protein
LSQLPLSAQRRVDAVLTHDQAEHLSHLRLIAELAETNRLPTMLPWIEFVKIGGLIAYASDRKERHRYLASCVDKVLRGENPGEIPIYQADKFVLAINLKTAKALDLAIPASVVARADEVIE